MIQMCRVYLFLSIGTYCMRRMSLLPQKFSGTYERLWVLEFPSLIQITNTNMTKMTCPATKIWTRSSLPWPLYSRKQVGRKTSLNDRYEQHRFMCWLTCLWSSNSVSFGFNLQITAQSTRLQTTRPHTDSTNEMSSVCKVQNLQAFEK